MHISQSFALLIILALTSSCSKKTAPSVKNQNLVVEAAKQPHDQANVANNSFIKNIAQESLTLSREDHARNILQITLGLRDALRNKPHKIPAFTDGSLFCIDDIASSCTLHTEHHSGELMLLDGVKEGSKIILTPRNTAPTSDQAVTSILSIKPINPTKKYSLEVLEEAFDLLEIGYASTEIGISLRCNGREANICTRGSERIIAINLAPEGITFSVEGYRLPAKIVLQSLFDIAGAEEVAVAQTETLPHTKKILFLLMPKKFNDDEFLIPYNSLKNADYEVDIVGLTSGASTGAEGTEVVAHTLLSSMSPIDFQAYAGLVIPGGNGAPKFLWDNQEVTAIIRYFHEHKKFVASFGYATIALAKSGILKNKTATTLATDETRQIFKKHNVTLDESPYVYLKDEHIITIKDEDFASLFSEEILKILQ